MNRRALVIGAAGAVAVGAGIATALWRRPTATTTTSPEPAHAWSQDQFDKPDGGKLALADFSGKPLLLNFWATWCPPCVKEMPLLDRFAQEQRAAGWQVVGLAIDKIELVREFLVKHPVRYPVAVAGLDALEWLRSLGNLGGGLPFSVVFDSAGALAQRKLGEISPPDLAAWVVSVR
jgi:thiol-disulfide isomerase/thioredoxin